MQSLCRNDLERPRVGIIPLPAAPLAGSRCGAISGGLQHFAGLCPDQPSVRVCLIQFRWSVGDIGIARRPGIVNALDPVKFAGNQYDGLSSPWQPPALERRWQHGATDG